MSDDKDDVDGSDWLSSQFDPTREVPKQPAPAAPLVPPAAQPAAPVASPPFVQQPAPSPPFVPSPAVQQPAVQPPPVAAPAPPAAADGGGFSWGLRPGGAAENHPPAMPVAPAPVVSTPAPPTQAPLAAMPPAPVSPPPPTPAPVFPTPVPPAPASPPPLVQPGSAPPLIEPSPVLPQPPTPQWIPQSTPSPTQPPTQAMPQAALWDDLSGVDQPTAAYTVQPWQPESTSAAPPPTQAMSSTQPISSTELFGTPLLGTPAFGAPPPALAPADPDVAAERSAGPADPTSAIDSLFADNKFQEYEELGVLQAISSPSPSLDGEPAALAPRAPVERAPITKTQRTLMMVAAGLVAVIALVALFFLGQRLGAASSAQAIPPAATSAATTAPTQAPVNGLAAPGVQPFAALQGGECVQPFTSAWAATYTVVDCTADHSGQLTFKGTLPDASTAAYPTGAQFQTEITPLCTAPTAINYGVAKAVTDLQVSFSYPASAQDWAAGDRTFYCFVNRAGGGALPGDMAAPKQ